MIPGQHGHMTSHRPGMREPNGPEAAVEDPPVYKPTSDEDDTLGLGGQELLAVNPIELKKLVDPHSVLQSPFILPGMDGVPFRGTAVPHLKDSDPDAIRPATGYEVKVNALNLGDIKDRDTYRLIYQLVVNRFAIIGQEIEVTQPDGGFPKVFLRWYLRFKFMPKQR